MGAYRGNADKVMADAKKIARRLRGTDATLGGVCKEYHCAHATMMRAVLSQMTKKQWRRIRKKKLAHGNIKSRFKKGFTPWNKGINWRPGGRSLETRFKRGHLPVNHKHTGTITIRNDKCGKQFRYIKISGIVQGRHKWIPYARYIWEKEHGPVPEKHFVVHKDGDTLNDSIENLKLVDRPGHLAQQMARDPKMIKKCRRNAGRAAKKRHAATRKRKERDRKAMAKAKALLKEQAGFEKQQAAKVNKLRGKAITTWECIGCGNDFAGEPPDICPKCNGLRFVKITQRRAG